LLPFFNTISLAASIFEARVEAFDANDISTSFRKDERSLALDKASTFFFMGNGLGSYFYIDYSGSEKKDSRSIYVHDFNTWVILKAGILGLVIFYLIFFKSCYNLFWCLKQQTNSFYNQYNLLLLSLFSSGLIVYIISFLANKFSTISGAVFLALFAAASAILKKKYESSI
jgi:hypothetical protein